MPAAVSKRQYRYMMAILHGKEGTSSRGDRVPKSVAGKYAGSKPGNLPDSKGKAHEGGRWDEKHHEADKKRVDEKRTERKKKKAKDREKMNKALENFLISNQRKAAGVLVVDGDGRILLGRRTDNGLWATPGGHVEDGESFEEGALRELREEAGIVGRDPRPLLHRTYRGYDSKTFFVKSFKGKIKNNSEMSNLKWHYISDIPWDQLTDYTCDAIQALFKEKLTKFSELQMMVAVESLQKNIIRSGNAPANTVYEVTHGDALKMVGNGTFRMLRNAVKDMGDEDFKDIKIDHYTLHIRKHTNDVYSGRVDDGHKQVHQFTNKSLPSVAVELMSLFEWYSPEDEKELEVLDESSLSDDAINGGLNSLVDNYRKHNISSIYSEMENIREEMRNGMAVDLQQVEQKMMKLFDKLEDTVMDIVDKHNELSQEAGDAVDLLESKLKELQTKIDEMGRQPVSVNAYSGSPKNDKKVHEEFYSYLPRPEVNISPDGHIKISFGAEWTAMERENFLKDMRAKVVKQKG
jgi:8-oxo-dGTP pyrophosphatase MutT (NUDIX family)